MGEVSLQALCPYRYSQAGAQGQNFLYWEGICCPLSVHNRPQQPEKALMQAGLLRMFSCVPRRDRMLENGSCGFRFLTQPTELFLPASRSNSCESRCLIHLHLFDDLRRNLGTPEVCCCRGKAPPRVARTILPTPGAFP